MDSFKLLSCLLMICIPAVSRAENIIVNTANSTEANNVISVRTTFEKFQNSLQNFTETMKHKLRALETEGLVFIKGLKLEQWWKEMIVKDGCSVIVSEWKNTETSFANQLIDLTSAVSDALEHVTNTSTAVYGDIQETMNVSDCTTNMANCSLENKEHIRKVIIGNICNLSGFCDSHGEISSSARKKTGVKYAFRNYFMAGPKVYKCKNGTVIPHRWVCDGAPDCAEAEEEKDCENACNEYETACGNGKCTWNFRFCDGKVDCEDGTDEVDCTNASRDLNGRCSTAEGEYLCANGKCIEQKSVCEGFNDCGDSSDEGTLCANCTGVYCGNLKCVSREKVCDGIDDCGDNSDENGCARSYLMEHECKMEQDKFMCTDGESCIDLYKVCDGRADCDDSSDETSKCATESCPPRCSGTFGGLCFVHPSGTMCLRTCPKGFASSNGFCRKSLPESVNIDLLIHSVHKVHSVMGRTLSEVDHLKDRTKHKILELNKRLSACQGKPVQ